jgi:S1-C subfamily serine protease
MSENPEFDHDTSDRSDPRPESGPWWNRDLGAGRPPTLPPADPPSAGAWNAGGPFGAWPPPPAGGWASGAWPPPPAGGWASGACPPPAPAGRTRSRGRRRVGALAATGAVVGMVAAGVVAGHELWSGATPGTAAAQGPSTGIPSVLNPFAGPLGGSGSAGNFGSTGTPASSSEGSGGPADVSAIAAKVDPGLVIIDTVIGYQQAEGAGTGMVLTPSGEVLTNNHVIDGATRISVTDVGNGRTYQADVVGYDPSADVAVLQLKDASGLATVTLARAAASTGEPVVAVGNAGGTGSLTAVGGSVTATDRSIRASDDLDGAVESLTGLIQTNADIQPGDSGGPLVDASGQVVGMDTAASVGYSLQGSYAGGTQGYAIPIGKAASIASQITAGVSSSTIHVGPTAFLGVYISTGQMGHGFEAFGGRTGTGAAVVGVTNGGPAQAAGIGEGDVITAVNGRPVASGTDLSRDLLPDHPGQVIQVTYTDSAGASHTVAITLQSGPPA